MSNDVTISSEKLDKFLNNIDKNLSDASDKVINDLANLALSEMEENYAKAEFVPGEELSFNKVNTENGKKVYMSGKQAAYSEFGTGTHGALHPHPIKSDFPLNQYNSGETIRPAKKMIDGERTTNGMPIPIGALYWTYQAEDGNVYYTQGIPAQKEVYDAGQTVKKKMKSIIKENLRGLF